MIEEAAMMGKFVGQKFESGDHPLARIGPGNVAAVLGDGDGSEAKSGRGDAGDDGVVDGGLAGVAAVLDQTGYGIRLLPEETKIRSLDLIEQLIVFGGEDRLGGRIGRCGRLSQCRKNASQGQGHCRPTEILKQLAPRELHTGIYHSTMLNDGVNLGTAGTGRATQARFISSAYGNSAT